MVKSVSVDQERSGIVDILSKLDVRHRFGAGVEISLSYLHILSIPILLIFNFPYPLFPRHSRQLLKLDTIRRT